MASITGNGSKGHHKFVLEVNQSSQNVVNNTSTISFAFKIAPIETSWNWEQWGDNIKYTITINGTVYSGSIASYDGYSTVTLKNGTQTVSHNTDGTKSISYSFKVTDSSGQTYTCGNASASGTLALTTISRVSSVSGGSGNIGEATTISITRASNTFTHTLKYSFGSLTGTIATGVGTSYNWTIPTTFYAQIPNSNTGTGSIICETYNGSTLIGSKTISFTAKVTNSNPIVGTFTYKDTNAVTTNITENTQRIIRSNSNLLFTIGIATAKNSATISKYEVIFNETTKSITSAGDLDFGTINLASDSKATLKVTDSRGNFSTKEITVTIDDWILPTALINLNRKNNYYSETTLKVDATYSSLNGKNSIAIQYQYRKTTDKNFSELYNLDDNVETTLDLDNNYQWHFIVVISDRIGETSYNYYIDKGIPLIFFDRLRNSIGMNGFPNSNNSFEVNGYPTLNGRSVQALSSFDDVGEGGELQRSGFYTVSFENVWYNLINIRHRNGQIDGLNYGMQIRNAMTTGGAKLEMRQQTNGTWTSWRKIQEEPVELYNNASGSSGTITLSETSANFTYLEIFYLDNNDADMKSVRVHHANNKIVTLESIEPNATPRAYIRASRFTIVGTAMTYVRSVFATIGNAVATVVTTDQYIKIMRVIGYR